MALIGLRDEPEKPCTGTRRTETCEALRHVDASRDALLAVCSFCSLCCMHPVLYFIFISSMRAAWGGELLDFIFLLYLSCSVDHERDWPPCKVDFSGWLLIR